MKKQIENRRRNFIKNLAAGTALGIPALLTTLNAQGESILSETSAAGGADDWFKNVKGKHRIVYDASEPHEGMPIIWAWVFYQTNNQTIFPQGLI